MFDDWAPTVRENLCPYIDPSFSFPFFFFVRTRRIISLKKTECCIILIQRDKRHFFCRLCNNDYLTIYIYLTRLTSFIYLFLVSFMTHDFKYLQLLYFSVSLGIFFIELILGNVDDRVEP